MKFYSNDLTDSQWDVIKTVLAEERKRQHDLRLMCLLLYLLSTGRQWRELPDRGVCWQLVYYYFRKWQADGMLEKLNWALNLRERDRQGKEASPSLMCIDSQCVKVALFIGQETGVDGNKKINGRKRHMVTDTLWLVWGVVVHARACGGQIPAPHGEDTGRRGL